jgi:hypothetical protein
MKELPRKEIVDVRQKLKYDVAKRVRKRLDEIGTCDMAEILFGEPPA